jgi:hypothetical protein
MSEQAESVLFPEVGPVIQRHEVGGDIVLMCRDLAVASFRRGDGIGRDVAIAALLQLGLNLKTDTIAALCEASHGWVCCVRARLKEGGVDVVIARSKRGRRRRVVGRTAEQLREMHAQGARQVDIAKALGVSESIVSLEVKRLGLPKRGWKKAQKGLPGLGNGAAKDDTAPHAVLKNAGAKVGDSMAAGEPSPMSREGEPTVCSMGGPASNGATAAPPEAEAVDGEDGSSTAETREDEGSGAAEENGPELTEAFPETEMYEEERGEERGVEAALATLETCDDGPPASDELMPGALLPSGPALHPCRYAGALLLSAATMVLGVAGALRAAQAVRPVESVYDAVQVLVALMASWASGYGSLESMHERDARALGVVLGLERSPSVRTLHRAISQIRNRFDSVALTTALMKGVLSVHMPDRWWFGVDGHFKAYSGEAPIDKGWDSKRRIASKGIADVYVTDELGWTWLAQPVAAGDSLSQHLTGLARTMRGVLGDAQPLVLAFDRGGFDFDKLNALRRDGAFYIGYVPGSVTLPDLLGIAPTKDGVGETLWRHPRLDHPARLLVERDGTHLIPIVTNMPTLIDSKEAVQGLRDRRGAQENSFKAARAFAHIDRLVDRGGATFGPDDRLIPNPERESLKKEQKLAQAREELLKSERPVGGERSRAEINRDLLGAHLDVHAITHELRSTPAKVPRVSVEPEAQRATLKTKNRLLLHPLKLASENARRWLVGVLGSALAPTDGPDDQDAVCRSLLALLRAPGWVRFEDDRVLVTLELPLPPKPHARLAAALEGLDHHGLLFPDGRRRVQFRLAPRPRRSSIPGATVERGRSPRS